MVSVHDANCIGTAKGSAEITNYVAPEGDIYLNDRYCVGAEIVLNNNIAESGNSFSWSTTGSGNLLNADTKMAKYVSIEEEELVEFTLTVNNGCFDSDFSSETQIIGTLANFSINPKVGDSGILIGASSASVTTISGGSRSLIASAKFSVGMGESISNRTGAGRRPRFSAVPAARMISPSSRIEPPW